jgi:hypothetical protein
LAFNKTKKKAKSGSSQHKFLKDSGMSFKEVFEFAFSGWTIPLMQNMANAMGKSKFIHLLKEATEKSAAKLLKQYAESLPNNDFSAFKKYLKNEDHFWGNVQTKNVVEETDRVIAVKFTECLWAETFRSAGAPDIGYAMMCHPDFAGYNAFNPLIKLTRTKTLMEGHDCCNHRCEWTE